MSDTAVVVTYWVLFIAALVCYAVYMRQAVRDACERARRSGARDMQSAAINAVDEYAKRAPESHQAACRRLVDALVKLRPD